MTDIVRIIDPSDVLSDVEKVFSEEKIKILLLLPTADVEHIGGTSIPGLLTKGDLDINVRVEAGEYGAAVEVLKSMYDINQSENWADGDYASFKSDKLKVDFGVQLTVKGAPHDFFLKFRDILRANPALVGELNALKQSFEGKPMDDYRKAKGEFIEKVLAQQASHKSF